MRKLNFLLIATIWLCGCNLSKNVYNIEPYPNNIDPRSGHYVITPETNIVISETATEDIARVVGNFAQQMSIVTGNGFKVSPKGTGIVFSVDSTIAAEGYILDVTKRGVSIKASTPNGMFYAIQTLYQLMPAEVYGAEKALGVDQWTVQCVGIEDSPRFAYRGMMLDEGRHFFGMDEVKKYLDIMAQHKLNKLHWHLTDDQGWRVEIKKHPKLTEIGSIRKETMILKQWGTYDNTPYGGYYTQDQIREIIKYATDRFITVIPEIDLPGHMVSVLAGYPELGCTGGPYAVSGQWGVMDDVLCVGNDKSMKLLEDVMGEIAELFPSEYIHIGGDECPKVCWEKCPKCQAKIKQLGLKDDDKFKKEHYLQSYVMNHMESFLKTNYGRRVIGWDEILEGDLSREATVMSWRGVEGGIEAANLGVDVIMTPTSYMYFDYYQSLDYDNEPFGIGGYVPIQKVYSFEPISSDIDPSKRHHILGVQANLWTEYIKTPEHLEYMLLPRLAALSEVQWTLPENKDLDRFMTSMQQVVRRYDIMKYNYAKHILDIMPAYSIDSVANAIKVELKSYGENEIYYTLDGSDPTNKSTRYTAPFSIDSAAVLKAVIYRQSPEYTSTITQTFGFNKATARKATLNTTPNRKYASNGAMVLCDGIRGTSNFSSGNWLGFQDSQMDITVDFGTPTECSSVTIGSLINNGDWIFPPTKIEVFGSDNGKDFSKLSELVINDWKTECAPSIIDYSCEFPKANPTQLKIVAHNVESIPDWHGGKGEKGFLFVDELIID